MYVIHTKTAEQKEKKYIYISEKGGFRTFRNADISCGLKSSTLCSQTDNKTKIKKKQKMINK